MTKSRLTEVEPARGVAILCVLLIHGTSAAVADIPVHTAAYVIYDLINRLSCYAVPAFVLYSGLVIFYRHSDTWSWRQTVPFYKRRLMFVLVPYVIWTYLYHLLNVGLGTSAPWSSLSDALHALLLGSSMYHLYFAVLIMQYYVLAPALLWFAYRYPNRLYGLLGFGVAVQVGAGYAVQRYELVPDPSLLSTTYFIAFVVGCCIGARYEDVMQWINRRIKWLAAAVPLTTGAFVWKQFADVYGGVPSSAQRVRIRSDRTQLLHRHRRFYAVCLPTRAALVRYGFWGSNGLPIVRHLFAASGRHGRVRSVREHTGSFALVSCPSDPENRRHRLRAAGLCGSGPRFPLVLDPARNAPSAQKRPRTVIGDAEFLLVLAGPDLHNLFSHQGRNQLDRGFGRPVPNIERRVDFDKFGARHDTRIGQYFHGQQAFAKTEAGGDGRTYSRSVLRIEAVQVQAKMDSARSARDFLQRLLHHPRNPHPIDLVHRINGNPLFLQKEPLARIQRTRPYDRHMLRLHFSAAADPDQSGMSISERHRQRHAVNVARGRRFRRIYVAMRVVP